MFSLQTSWGKYSSLQDSDDFDITDFPSGPGAPAAPGSPWAPCVNEPACQFYHSLRQTVRQGLNINTKNFYTSAVSIWLESGYKMHILQTCILENICKCLVYVTDIYKPVCSSIIQ